VFIAFKKPYILDRYHRPLANKVIASLICILFGCGAMLESNEAVQKAVPVVIVTLELVMIAYSGYLSLKRYPENL
jgi:hypothetical protein